MIDIKKAFIRLVYIVQITLYGWYYHEGYQGYRIQKELCCETNQIKSEIANINKEINDLAQEIEMMNSIPFYKEKIAREQLHMAYPDEIIYYIV